LLFVYNSVNEVVETISNGCAADVQSEFV